MLQKKHQQIDIPKVSQAGTKPLVGGHLQPITYRPPTFPSSFHNRRNGDIFENSEQSRAIRYIHQPVTVQQVYQPSQFLHPLQTAQSQTSVTQLPSPQFQSFHNNFANQPTQLATQQSLGVNQNLVDNRQYQFVHQQPQQYQPGQFRNQIPQLNHQQPHQNQIVFQQPHFVLQQPHLINQQPHLISQQSQLTNQQSHLVNQQSQLVSHHPQLANQHVARAYTPFNFNQRQYQDQQNYNQYFQLSKLQEEQTLKAQLSKQYNRFDLANYQQNIYIPRA